MRLLFDQNLSRHLVRSLADLYPESRHVLTLDLDATGDNVIWDYAIANGLAIVSKDADFAERSLLTGEAPKIIWVRIGNSGTSEVEALIRSEQRSIQAFLTQSADTCLVLTARRNFKTR